MLDTTCNVVSANCATVMSNYASRIQDPAACGADFRAENPLVIRAYYGFLAYTPLYQAGCLKADPRAVSSQTPSEYCFVAAARNTAAPADSYLYYLPLGTELPGSSRPSCSSCVQQTMQIFAQAAQNLSTPIAGDYSDAATQVNFGCGPNWVSPAVKPLQGTGNTTSTNAAGPAATRAPAMGSGVLGVVAAGLAVAML